MRLPSVAFGFLLGAVVFITASVALAWSGPTSPPPAGNVSAPLNVGTTDQIKDAGLGLNALAVFGNTIISGASRYLNFGDSAGESGYGIRDKAGVMEFKNAGGSWSNLSTIPTCPSGNTLVSNGTDWACSSPAPPPPPVEITFRSSAQSAASTITVPNDVLAGDILVLADRTDGPSLAGTAVPAGFTAAVNTSGFETRMIISYKVADGNEAGTMLTGMTNSEINKVLFVFAANAISVGHGTFNSSGVTHGDPSSQLVSAPAGSPPLIVLAMYGSNGTINPRTFSVSGSPAKDGELEAASADSHLWLAYKIYNSSPANVTVDMDDEGFANALQSGYIAAMN